MGRDANAAQTWRTNVGCYDFSVWELQTTAAFRKVDDLMGPIPCSGGSCVSGFGDVMYIYFRAWSTVAKLNADDADGSIEVYKIKDFN